MTNKQALTLFKEMKSKETYESMVKMCDVAIAALEFQKHFDALKEFQHLEEVIKCDECIYSNNCSHSVTITQYSENTISSGPRHIKFCSGGKRRDDDGKE